MQALRILTLGTADYLETYATDLQKDCEKYDYDFAQVKIDQQKDISNINHVILEKMVDYILTNDFERLCFMDPECRIVAPVPSEWIESDRPVVFYKIRNEDGTPDPKFVYKNNQGNGERLPCRIIGQPMFISKRDTAWFKMTLDLSRAASDRNNHEYTRNEMFIETSLEYNKIDYHKECIVYNRHSKVPHKVVKGTWETPETVIKHPDVYSLFDTKSTAGNPVFHDDPLLDQKILERHTMDLETLEKMNKHMWLESSEQWEDFGEWTVHAKTGRIKLKGYKGVKYHHTIRQKIEQNLYTPLVKAFTKKENLGK